MIFKNICSQEIIQQKLPESDKIIIRLMFRNGSVSDPVGKEGLTYLTANLITSGGTTEYTYSRIQDKLYPMAAFYNCVVDKEVTVFTFQVHKDFINEFYLIIKGLILTPSFSEADFDRIKSNQQTYTGQIIRASSDEEYSKKALEDFLFRGTRYQHMVEGKTESIKSITLNDVKEHYTKYFTKKNLIAGITGNFSEDLLNTLISDLDKLPGSDMPLLHGIIPTEPDGIRIEIISKQEAFGSAIFMGFPMNITRSDDEFAALMVANSYLGEHRKSYGVLYEKLRTIRSMNYGDYSYIEWYHDGGGNMLPSSGVPRRSNYFSIWIRPVQIAKQLIKQYPELSGTKIGHAHFATRLAIREVDKLVKNGMTLDDFEETRQFLLSYVKLYVQKPVEQLGYLMDSRFYGRKDYINELINLLKRLKVQDVNKAIKKYWQVKNMYIVIVTDKDEAEELAESFRKNLYSPMSYSTFIKNGLPKNILDEDEEIANYKLNIKTVSIIKNEDTFK